MSGTPSKVYLTRAGGSGEDELYALDHGVAILGFREYPTLADAKDYNAIVELVKKARPELTPRAAGNHAGQLWAFAIAMQPGDIVVLPRKQTSQVALGLVTGPYPQVAVNGDLRHTRAVEWVRPDIARSVFGQDLLYSFGAFMTVCNITRNGAESRVAAVLAGKPDPGYAPLVIGKAPKPETFASDAADPAPDLAQAAHDQIEGYIKSHFSGHALARLVDAVLCAEGWTTKISPEGADGGVDILAGRGLLGLDHPRLCVQVKSELTSVAVDVYRNLQGVMQSFKAEQGLLVAWGGFNKVVVAEARQNHFAVRLWDSRDLVQAIYRNYARLSEEIQAELPLKPVWMLVRKEGEA